MENRIYNQDAYQKNCNAIVIEVLDQHIFLDQTVFFAQGGGQAGDVGVISWEGDHELEIITSINHKATDRVAHVVCEEQLMPAVGTKVNLQLNWEKRHMLMRMHSCLHLVCSVIEGDVTGGQIDIEKGRLDFNLAQFPMSKDEIADAINALIMADHTISTHWISEEDLSQRPELVRTIGAMPPSKDGRIKMVQIGNEPDLVDLQPCGGTHVASTSEIGKIRVGKIQNKGKNNRRINIHFAE